MKTLGKILGLLFLGLLLIAVALGFALTHLLDPNDYKDEIRQLARDRANLELTLNGDIGWSLYPWLGLELHQTSVASARTPDQPFADLQMLGLAVRVLPLLHREVQMSDIRIEGLVLTLRRDEQGHGNWEDIGRPARPTQVAEATDQQTARAVPSPAGAVADDQPLRLGIDSLTVNNSRVDYHDARSGQHFSAEGIHLKTGAIRKDSNIPLKLSALLSTSQPVLRAQTSLGGELRFNRALKRYQLENARLSGEVSGEPLAGKTLSIDSEGQLLVDLAAQVAEWSGLRLNLNQMRAMGELKVRDLDKTPQLSGRLSVAPLNLREFLAGLGRPLPAMADAASLDRFAMTTRLSGTPNSLTFDELDLKLDDSRFTGHLAVTDLARKTLSVQLKGDHLDLDRYLPPQDKEDSAGAARQTEVKATEAVAILGSTPLPKAPTQQAWSSEPLLPVGPLRQLNVEADLTLAQLTVHQLPVTNVQLQANGSDGLLKLQDLRGELFGGSFETQAQLDARPDQPQLSLQQHVSRIPVEKFLKTEAGQQPPIKGLLDLTAELTTSGRSQQAWIDGLNGTASFVLSDGMLPNANLEQQLCLGIALLNRKMLSNPPQNKDTPFQTLQGSLRFTNGVAHNPDLKASVPGLTVNGNGDLDLRVLGMDYRIGIVVEGDQRTMPDAACQIDKRYAGLDLPVRCRGPLELGARACRLDRDGLSKNAARLGGKKLEQKIQKKLGDKIGTDVKDKLKGLFGQ